MGSKAHPKCNKQPDWEKSATRKIGQGAQGNREMIVLEVDPLVQLMKVEKTPDSTYEMIGGVDKQIKEPL